MERIIPDNLKDITIKTSLRWVESVGRYGTNYALCLDEFRICSYFKQHLDSDEFPVISKMDMKATPVKNEADAIEVCMQEAIRFISLISNNL